MGNGLRTNLNIETKAANSRPISKSLLHLRALWPWTPSTYLSLLWLTKMIKTSNPSLEHRARTNLQKRCTTGSSHIFYQPASSSHVYFIELKQAIYLKLPKFKLIVLSTSGTDCGRTIAAHPLQPPSLSPPLPTRFSQLYLYREPVIFRPRHHFLDFWNPVSDSTSVASSENPSWIYSFQNHLIDDPLWSSATFWQEITPQSIHSILFHQVLPASIS